MGRHRNPYKKPNTTAIRCTPDVKGLINVLYSHPKIRLPIGDKLKSILLEYRAIRKKEEAYEQELVDPEELHRLDLKESAEMDRIREAIRNKGLGGYLIETTTKI